MRVLHVIESLALGGAERVVTDLINTMPEGVSCYACCLQRSGEMAERLSKDTPVIELHSPGGHDFSLPKKIHKIIQNFKIDIVHAHNWNTFIESIIGSQLGSSTPIIHTIHGPYIEYPSGSSFLKRFLRRAIERMLVRKSCRVCVVSESIKEYTATHLAVPFQKVEVVTNGVNTNLRYRAPSQVRFELGLNEEDIVLCSVGRLASIKNLNYFFSVLPAMFDLIPNTKVLIVGDGPLRRELENIIEKLGMRNKVLFLGFKADTGDYLHCADIFILPSKYEGISISLLEAMAAGLPTVATDVGGNNQLVTHGETGYLIPLDSEDIFLDALVGLAKDSCKRSAMSVNAVKKVATNFSLERTAAHYLTIYHSCLNL